MKSYPLRHKNHPLVHPRQVDIRVPLLRVFRDSAVNRLSAYAVFVCFLVQPNFHRHSQLLSIDAKKVSLADDAFDERAETFRVQVDRRVSADRGVWRVEWLGTMEAMHDATAIGSKTFHLL